MIWAGRVTGIMKTENEENIIETDKFKRHRSSFQKRREFNEMLKDIERQVDLSAVQYDEMSDFGRSLYDQKNSVEVRIDPGLANYDNSDEQVKALQAMFRNARSAELKAKLEKKIKEKISLPGTLEMQYLGLRYISENDLELKELIRLQMLGKDVILNIPTNIQDSIDLLLSKDTILGKIK
ncbi:MAG: hypothetical protein ACJAS1_004292 [Oleiphilaceae bacterium]|jgi:hypothetical protein